MPLLRPCSGWLILFFSAYFCCYQTSQPDKCIPINIALSEAFEKHQKNGTRRKLEEAAFDLGTPVDIVLNCDPPQLAAHKQHDEQFNKCPT